MKQALREFAGKFATSKLPDIRGGMRVRVWSKIKEGDKWRAVAFEGVVIATKHGKSSTATFTVRKIGAAEVGVERTWPLHSPLIEKVEVLEKGKARRAKLYFLRERSKRETRAKLKTAVSKEKTERDNVSAE